MTTMRLSVDRRVVGLVIAIVLIQAFLSASSQIARAATNDWQLSIDVTHPASAWNGIHDDKPIGDSAFLVTIDAKYKGQEISGATVIADIRFADGHQYWFKDGTGSLYVKVQYDGRDDRGRQQGSPYDMTSKNGHYVNLLEVDEQYFGTGQDCFINATVYAPGLPVYTSSSVVHLQAPSQGFGHHIKSMDLDASTQQNEWQVVAKPGQNLMGKLVLDESPNCSSGCCPYHISAWGAPFETWGKEYRMAQGCMAERKNVTLTWNYTVPAIPGSYLLTLSDSLNSWWPSYNESVFFVGKVIVESATAVPKVELVSPANGTKLGSYKVPLQWKGSGFTPLRPSYIVLMDDQDGRNTTLAQTFSTGTNATFSQNGHRKWSVLGYDGLTRYPSTVWEFSVERNVSMDVPPTVKLISPANRSTSKYHDVTFNWSGSDLEGDLITYTFEVRYSTNRTLITTHDMIQTGFKVWLPEGDLVWTVIPRDPWKTGSCLNGSWALTISVPPNTAPYSTLLSPPSGKVFGNQSIDFRWDGYDAECDTIQYKLEVRDAFTHSLYVERYVYTKNVTLWLAPWSYNWTVIPFDGQLWGWCKNGSWSLTVAGPLNRPPVISSRPTNNAFVGRQYNYKVLAKDPDGDILTYSLLEGPSNMSIDAHRGMITWTPGPDDLGVREVSVLVLDGRGGKTIQTFDLHITKDVGPIPSNVETTMPSVVALLFVLILAIAVASVSALRNKKS